MCRLKKTLYELKQALKAWYKRLTIGLLKQGFERRGVDKTLFIHRINFRLLVAQIYVDDVVFRATSNNHALSFVEKMKKNFEMKMVGELNFFLGLHIRQLKNGILLSQSKYVRKLVKSLVLS